jgi:hypothetical protein
MVPSMSSAHYGTVFGIQQGSSGKGQSRFCGTRSNSLSLRLPSEALPWKSDGTETHGFQPSQGLDLSQLCEQ